METLFTTEDVQTWELANSRKMAILKRRLGEDLNSTEDAQGLNMLSLAYQSSAFTSFAKRDCENAKELLRLAVVQKLRIIELNAAGCESALGYTSTGEFQTILLGFASGDLPLAMEFARKYSTDLNATKRSPADSNYIGLPLKQLALGNLQDARELLLRPRPRKVDPQFAGYIECEEAIANRDALGFQKAIKEAERYWHAFMKRVFRGHPQAVCFVAGLGFQRLAEVIMQETFDLKLCCGQ